MKEKAKGPNSKITLLEGYKLAARPEFLIAYYLA